MYWGIAWELQTVTRSAGFMVTQTRFPGLIAPVGANTPGYSLSSTCGGFCSPNLLCSHKYHIYTVSNFYSWFAHAIVTVLERPIDRLDAVWIWEKQEIIELKQAPIDDYFRQMASIPGLIRLSAAANGDKRPGLL